ncbi:MAG: lipid IV(A) 3-deoxy-D-manno-octulosonic acid transferase [Gammaproteobacteria bacterium]|nr:lipid IV(A) 3-deoxy-D-manno-octulosonic acid transferase [Gammaproteobacteria bacterium]
MRNLYSLLMLLLLPILLLRLYWRGFKAPMYRERWQERLGYFRAAGYSGCIWLHAVSVGEVQAAVLLIRRLLEEYPHLPMVITTTTPTGAQRVKELFADEVIHLYGPFDMPFINRRFFDRLQPRLLILMETEIWPNLIHEAYLRHVPTLLANARLSVRSAQRYHRLSGLTRETLQKITLIAPQGESDAERFRALGARHSQVEVTGSIKFDIRLSASLREQSEVQRRAWGSERPVWLAASTHEGEEEQILRAHRRIRSAIPECLLVLVPRHPERFDLVAELASASGFTTTRRSVSRGCDLTTAVFVGDTMGELPLLFGAADVAFIGGSLVPHGGHNLLEAAAQSLPVVFGPHMFNFTEISELFLEKQAAWRVQDPDELAEVVTRWLQSASERSRIGENGRALLDSQRGALQKLTILVDGFLGTDSS